MNNYYVIRVEFNKVAQAENREIYAYSDLDSALAQFHSIMGKDIKNTTLSRAMVVVLNSIGGVVEKAVWEEQIEPEPIPEV